DEITILIPGNKSVSEAMCDIAATKQSRLRFLRNNQGILYADLYQKLADTAGNIINRELNLNNLRHPVILPSTYIRSSHQIFEIFQDSMAIT
ncbi:15989_t:CDS:2, partial [Racocetra persica]